MGETVKICRGLTVRERSKGSGIYYVFFNHNNRRVNKRLGEFVAALSYAKSAKDSFIENPDSLIEKLRRKPPKPKVPTFEQAAETWLENIIRQPRNKGGLAPSSVERYEQMARDYIYPEIGSKKCDQITPQRYADLLETCRAKMSLSSIGVINRVVSGTIMYAVSRGRVAMADPTYGITKALGLVRDKKRAASQTVETLTEKQLGLYLDTCAVHESYYLPIFTFYINTGCRMGEAFGLTWDNVDFDRGSVQIVKAIRKGRVGEVKTRQKRVLKLTAPIQTLLKNQKVQQENDRRYKKKGYVFLSRQGEMMPQSTIDNANKRILKRAELPYVKVHALRHSFVTENLKRGADPRAVADYAGHHDTRVTQVNYAHLVENEMPTEMTILGSGKLKRAGRKSTGKRKGVNVLKFRQGT